MLDEIVLQLVGFLQRLVLVLQRPLDIDAVGDVDEGHHHLAVGQMDDRVAQHGAGVQLDLAVAIAPLVVEAGDGGDETAPRAVALACCRRRRGSPRYACRRRTMRVEAPQRRESRVRQAHAAVRPEHGDALGKIVERLALHAHRRLVAAFEVDLLGQVLEHPGDAAIGLRIGDDADGAAVGQVPPMFLRIDGTVGGEQVLLPAPPFRLLGDLAVAAQPVEQQRIVGRARQKLCSRSHSFWNAWLKKRSFWFASKIATAVVSRSSVSAWLRIVR